MGFGTIMAKNGVSNPKSVYSKNCISGSQGRWTLGFCMEAMQSLQSLHYHWFEPEAQENHIEYFGLGAQERWQKWPKCQHGDMCTHRTQKPT